MSKDGFFSTLVKLMLGDTSSLEENLREKTTRVEDDDEVTEVSYDDSLPHYNQEDVKFVQ